MQDEKEDFKGFVKTTKKKVRDWVSRYPRATRILEYFGLLLLFSLAFYFNFTHFKLFHTDAESARYLLSALVQSQAAIVAIVISLTLVAVQLTASAYSPRVIDIFKKNLDMWILLGFYGFSIYYGLFLLKLVEGAEGELVSQSAIWALGRFSISFEFGVSLAYWLGAFTFVILIPYMWNIMDLLKSESIINRLKIEITKDNLLNTEEDPIQPIMDIIHGSIMKYDLETTRVGLKAVTVQVLKIISTDGEEEISRHFCNQLTRVGRLAISRDDVESAIEVIDILNMFGRSAAEEGFEVATLRTALSLGDVGKIAIEKGFDAVTKQATWSLEEVGRTAAEKGFEVATQHAALFLGEVGEAAADIRLEVTISQVALSLIAVGRTTAEKGLEDATRQAAESLAKLTLSSEEIVKTTIQKYESILEEQYCETFQKFMKAYEQELKKLRAKK